MKEKRPILYKKDSLIIRGQYEYNKKKQKLYMKYFIAIRPNAYNPLLIDDVRADWATAMTGEKIFVAKLDNGLAHFVMTEEEYEKFKTNQELLCEIPAESLEANSKHNLLYPQDK